MEILNNQAKSYKKYYIIGGIILAFVLFLMLCFRTVGAGQVGIVTRFGEIDRVAASGIAIKMPWPIERLEKMEIRVQKEEQSAAAATSDLQDVNATLALNYALNGSTALEVYKELGKEYKDRVVTPAVQESFKAATADYTAAELLTKRPEVKAKAYGVIKARLDKYGIRVVDLNIVNFSFSAEFSKAIEEKQVAAQQAEKSKYQIEIAKNEAQALVEGAKGTAEKQRLISQSATPAALQRLALDKWDGKLPLYNGGGTVFNIPLK